MKIVMDSDCLIKLTKAGIKELVCSEWDVSVPGLVRRETVLAAPHLPDATRIRENIDLGLIHVDGRGKSKGKGEDATLQLYKKGGFQAIATDDARFIRQLRGLGLPYAVPAVIVVELHRRGSISKTRATEALDALADFISADEYAAARLMLTGGYTS
jgi:hypothetical protein